MAAIATALTTLARVLGTNLAKNLPTDRLFCGSNVSVPLAADTSSFVNSFTFVALFNNVAEKRRMLRDRSAASISTIV